MHSAVAIARRCLAVLSFGLLSACSTTPDDRELLVNTSSWELQSWVVDGEAKPLEVGFKKPTLSISDDGRVSGSASVNRYNSDVEFISAGELLVSSRIITTRRGGPRAAMDQEQWFLATLPRLTQYSITSGVLRLEGGDSWMEFVGQ